jgi:hypothetical protein
MSENILDIPSSPEESSGEDKPTLEEILQRGYKFDFSKYFETGFEIVKKDIWGMIGYTALKALIIAVSFLTVIGPLFVMGPLSAGYYVVGEKIARGEPHEFGDYFKGFQFLSPTVVFSVIILGLVIVVYGIMFLFFFSGSQFLSEGSFDFDSFLFTGGMIMFIFIVMLIVLFLNTIWTLVFPLIVNGNLGATTAMKISMRIAMKNFWWMLLYSFVLYLVEGAGSYILYVGLLFTVPLNSMLKLGAYINIVGLGDKTREAEVLA